MTPVCHVTLVYKPIPVAVEDYSRVTSASKLPVEWDELAECIFQRRDFLLHAERYNACSQRYYTYVQNGTLLAGACVYTLPVELFTFSRLKGRTTMQVLGLPASVSASGLLGHHAAAAALLLCHIQENERGLILGLNLEPGTNCGNGIEMTMLPTVVVNTYFNSWDEYLSAFRAPYRHRARRILQAFDKVACFTTSCQMFTEAHHALYMQILQRTPSKLEVLSCEFFRNLPEPFKLTSCYLDGSLVCWHVTCSDEDTLYFFFGGHDYAYLHSHHVYFNNLFSIVAQAIAGGYRRLDLGQTAEIAKIKTGGQPVYKSMFFYHRKLFIRMLLALAKPLITYHPPNLQLHTQKENALRQKPETIEL